MPSIILHTELNAEDNAMLQALYSRSADSVTDHLKRLQEVGSSKFMSQYYLGYGHASIGDCGTETIYFEGISMLAAKAIEDNPLFVGQECSSRYIDFSEQLFLNPQEFKDNDEAIQRLYWEYRSFYINSLEPLKADLRLRFPIGENDKPTVYEKAIAARAFDILRGFLPAGATTNVAWTARLSNAGEHLIWMMHHPLDEVRQLGLQAYKQMQKKYPNSFHVSYAAMDPEYIEAELCSIEDDAVYDFNSDLSNFYARFNDEALESTLVAKKEDIVTHIDLEFNSKEMMDNFSGFKARPKKTKLHKHSLSSHLSVNIAATMDFGSFRDIQRHRNGYCSMPLLTAEYGVHPWYYDNLTNELRTEAAKLLQSVRSVYDPMINPAPSEEGRFTENKSQNVLMAEAQYILPMGNVVEVVLKYSVQQAVYVSELRSGKTVHATVRPFAQALARKLEKFGIPVYNDKEASDWTVRRGEQDIVAKQTQ